MSEDLNNSSRVSVGASSASAVAESPNQQEHDVRRLAAGTGIALGGKMLGGGARLAVDIALARLLGPFNYGLYAIGWTLLRFVALFSPLGLNAGAIHFGARYWRRDDGRFKGVVLQSLRLALLSGGVMGLGFYLAAPWLGERVFQKPDVVPVIQCFGFVFPLLSGLTVAAAVTRVSQRMKFSVLSEDLGEPTAQLALIFLLFWMWKGGLAAAMAACIFAYGFGLLQGLRFIRRLFPEVSSKQVKAVDPGKGLLAYSLPTALTGVFGVLLIWVDRLLVGYFRPAAEVGIYQASSQLAVSFALILVAFNAIFSPMTADFFHRGQIGRLEELYRVSTKWGLYLSLPGFMIMFFASRSVMTVLYGHAYAAGWIALSILALGQVVNAGTGPCGSLLVMTGHQNKLFIISGLTFVVSVILGLILIPRWGMAGAAISTTLSLSGLFISSVLLARRVLGMRPHDRRFSKGVLATALTLTALILLRFVHISSPVLSLVLNSILSIGVFGGTLLLCGLEPEDRHFIDLIRARMMQNRGRVIGERA